MRSGAAAKGRFGPGRDMPIEPFAAAQSSIGSNIEICRALDPYLSILVCRIVSDGNGLQSVLAGGPPISEDEIGFTGTMLATMVLSNAQRKMLVRVLLTKKNHFGAFALGSFCHDKHCAAHLDAGQCADIIFCVRDRGLLIINWMRRRIVRSILNRFHK